MTRRIMTSVIRCGGSGSALSGGPFADHPPFRAHTVAASRPDYAPLMFGPLPDVVNPRMGSVYRETHRQAAFVQVVTSRSVGACAGTRL